jgi:glutathione S-transferase
MRFILGTPATSSWSLRAYLGAGELTKSANIDWRSFDAQSKLTDATDCPTRQVPVVYFDEAAPAIIETFAIIEALAERGGLCWPIDSLLRARARSFCLEFQHHSDALRTKVPMDFRDTQQIETAPAELFEWLSRLETLLNEGHGEFLYGELSAADAWFAPLIARGIRCRAIKSESLQRYTAALKNTQGWCQWAQLVDDCDPAYR